MPETTRIDVARIMQEIRDEVRARHDELERRIEHARQQLLGAQGAGDRLAHAVARLNEVFDIFYVRMRAYLQEQMASYPLSRHTLQEINRLLADPEPERGARDFWWNPVHWVKRLLQPLRRYVMRRQYDVNMLMRDVLTYLVNHSAHVELLQMELEMGVERLHAANALLGSDGLIETYFNEWPRVMHRPVLAYAGERLEAFVDRHGRALQKEVDEYLTANFEALARESGARLARLERQLAALAPAKVSGVTGFDNLELAGGVRGEESAIRQRQARFVDYLRGQRNVLDAGCGRGEFLELLRENEILAYGIDVDERMVKHCQDKGLDARCEDILDHLEVLPDESLGGLVAFQLIEHMDFPRLFQFVQLAGRKMQPGGRIILETVNPSCLTVFSGAFYADPTHQRPVHTEAARKLLEMAGFGRITVDFLSPVPESARLKPVAVDAAADPGLRAMAEAVNFNIERINSVLYGYADYAIIGQKLAGV